jgi:peroxiredoxin Q/BCP
MARLAVQCRRLAPTLAYHPVSTAMPLQPGIRAPEFSAVSDNGSTISLTDYRGKKLVLYFYPKDGTPICTAQACSLRDHEAEITAKGAAILGVSAQNTASHQKFVQKCSLNFPLIADPGRAIAQAYDATGSGLAGLLRRLLGVTARVTYLIDERGYIASVVDRPDGANHGQEVLKLLV